MSAAENGLGWNESEGLCKLTYQLALSY